MSRRRQVGLFALFKDLNRTYRVTPPLLSAGVKAPLITSICFLLTSFFSPITRPGSDLLQETILSPSPRLCFPLCVRSPMRPFPSSCTCQVFLSDMHLARRSTRHRRARLSTRHRRAKSELRVRDKFKCSHFLTSDCIKSTRLADNVSFSVPWLARAATLLHPEQKSERSSNEARFCQCPITAAAQLTQAITPIFFILLSLAK